MARVGKRKSPRRYFTIVARAYQATALAAAGDRDGSRRLFADAEERQAKYDPNNPRLFSLRGYQFCDFLLGEGCFAETSDRAKYSLSGAYTILDSAFNNVGLGRAALGVALSVATPLDAPSPLPEARQHFETAIAALRRSNAAIYIPLGHLARARLSRAVGEFAAARRDLDEVLEIAEPGPMRLHLCDMRLELCRLALAELFCFAPLAPTPPARPKNPESLKQTARQELATAAKLIADCGYHRRDAERDELAAVIEGKRQLGDLPIRV